jgi:hypothetical protein
VRLAFVVFIMMILSCGGNNVQKPISSETFEILFNGKLSSGVYVEAGGLSVGNDFSRDVLHSLLPIVESETIRGSIDDYTHKIIYQSGSSPTKIIIDASGENVIFSVVDYTYLGPKSDYFLGLVEKGSN